MFAATISEINKKLENTHVYGGKIKKEEKKTYTILKGVKLTTGLGNGHVDGVLVRVGVDSKFVLRLESHLSAVLEVSLLWWVKQ